MSLMQEYISQGLLPGAITLIAHKGKLIHEEIVGYSDIETQKPLRLDSKFRLFSMSKPITSCVVMKLIEENKLTLDTAVHEFIPSFKDMRVYTSGTVDAIVTEPTKQAITIQHLLTHTAGLTYHFLTDHVVQEYYRRHGVFRKTPAGGEQRYHSAADNLPELMERLTHAPLLYQPGTSCSYSYSTTVLGYIIEKICGDTLPNIYRQKIFDPLEMHDTSFIIPKTDLDKLTNLYRLENNQLELVESATENDSVDEKRLLDAGGSLLGTAQDYMKFTEMITNKGQTGNEYFLSPKSFDLITNNYMPAGAKIVDHIRSGFGLGLAIGNKLTEEDFFIPDGLLSWSGLGNTFFWCDTKKRLSVVFMTHVIAPENELPFRGKIMSYLSELE